MVREERLLLVSRLLREGKTCKQIAERFHCGKGFVYGLIREARARGLAPAREPCRTIAARRGRLRLQGVEKTSLSLMALTDEELNRLVDMCRRGETLEEFVFRVLRQVIQIGVDPR